MTPLAYLQQSAERLCDAIDRKAERHVVQSAAAIVRDALAASRRGAGRPRKIDPEAVVERYSAGSSVAEIAADLECSQDGVRKALRASGVKLTYRRS